MFERKNIESLTAGAEQRQMMDIQRRAESQFKRDIEQRESLTPEGLVARTAMETIVAIDKLSRVETNTRVRMIDVVLRRQTRINRAMNRRTHVGLGNLDSVFSLGDMLYHKYYELRDDATHVMPEGMFKSNWRIQYMHHKQIDRSNYYGHPEVKDSFYEIDILRITRNEGNLAKAHAFSITVGEQGQDLRSFTAFDQDGVPKDTLLSVASDNIEQAISIMQTAQSEIAEDIRLLG